MIRRAPFFAALFAAAAFAARGEGAAANAAANGEAERSGPVAVAPEEVDASIERGLAFLAASMNPDGTYPRRHGSGGAVTSLAGMAFLAKGFLPGPGRYGSTLERAVDCVLDRAGPDGFLGDAEGGNGRMYAHSICTLFLSEVSGMVDPERQKRIDAVLPGAVKILLDAQNVPKNAQFEGGWRYQRDSTDSDMSCTGWALMALRSSRLNGGDVPPEAIARAVEFVKRQQNLDDGSFRYQGRNGSCPLTLTGAGILCLELCGRHNDPSALHATRRLLEIYTDLGKREGNRCYGLYYTSQGLFQTGGEAWKEFENWMYSTWMPRQHPDGSWREEEDSPAYNTAMMVLAFAVPYRQLPIYQRDETVDED